MQEIVDQLVRLRRVGQTMLLLQRVCVIAAWVVGVTAALILLDYVVRMPGPMRLFLLLAGIAALGAACWTYLRPAIEYRPDLTSLALRVERTIPALSGRLASGVEFAQSGLAESNPLAARAVAEAQRRAATHPLAGVIDSRRTRRDAVVFAVVALIATGLVMLSPATARTGLERIMFPFSGAQWPARTGVESLMVDGDAHPRGIPLPLRAKATLGDIERMRVNSRFRFVRNGQPGEWRSVMLTHQGDGLYEQLVDTDADAIEFIFQTEDAQTTQQLVRLVEPPSVRRATLTVEPPPYAPGVPVATHELGPGTDRRAAAPPVAEGSAVRLDLALNKPLPVPAVDGPGREQWVRGTLGWGGETLPSLTIDESDPARWTVSWNMNGTAQLALNLVDTDGIGNIDDIAYRIDAAPDRDPTVSIVEPQTDDAVLPTAVVNVLVEARDDLGVASVALDISREATNRGEPAVPLRRETREGGQTTERLEHTLSLADLEAVPGQVILLQAEAVDAFELEGRAHDAARSPVRRLRVITETELVEQIRRQLAVVRQNAIRIDTEQGELERAIEEAGPMVGAGRRQSQVGERLAQQSEALRLIAERQMRNGLGDEELEELLRATEERLERAGQASNRAAEALEERLAELSRDGAGSPQPGERAPGDRQRDGREGAERQGAPTGGEQRADGQASDQPPSDQQSGDQPGDQQRGDRPENDRAAEARPQAERERDEPVLEAQREVREELADLIALLDRDEDAWVVTRRLERLQEALEQAQRDTARLANQTVGRDREELSESELSELERIAARQRDAADEAGAVLDDMERRAEALDRLDPDRAGVMRQAARSGQQGSLERHLEEGAEQTAANRLQNAQASQQAAQRALDDVLRNMKESRRARARELQRQLASLVQSIERLVITQEDELIALAQVEDDAGVDDRARALIRLIQNTDAVTDEARRAGREADRIVRVLGRASDAQGAAVQALRAEPADLDRARDTEERALELLKEALAEAQKLQDRVERAEAERQREEMLELYRNLAETQVALLQETRKVEQEGGRRQLLDARRVGIAQGQVRTTLADLSSEYPAVEQSSLFSLTHRRMDEWSQAAESALAEGGVGEPTQQAQSRIADSLSRIVQALESAQPDPEPFERAQAGGDDSGGGNQGGAQPPLIPPVAELKLLRGLQEQVYEATKSLDTAEATPTREAALQLLAEEQRELFQLALEMLAQLSQQQPDAPDRDQAAPDDNGGQP